MKKIKQIIFASAVLMAAVSCDDFLDTKNLTNKTTENFPETEADAQEMVTAIYAHLLFESPETSSQVYIAQVAGDDCLGGNLSFSTNCATNFLLYKDNLNTFLNLWSRDYTLINRANSALPAFDNVREWSSEEEKNRLIGETYFLRAFAYNELVQVFGGVPLRTTTETVNLPRASVDEVYALIEDDLLKAISLMPDKIYPAGSTLSGHATKYAAEAMLARVFLFYTGRYAKTTLPNGTTKEQVIQYLEDCINNSGHKLIRDQREIWGYTNKTVNKNNAGLRYKYAEANNLEWAGNSCEETLFANKHNLTSDWTYTWFSNTWQMFCSPSNDNRDIKQSYPFSFGWGIGPVSPSMVEEWKEWSSKQTFLDGYTEDPRITGSIWSYTAYDPNNAGNILLDRKMDPNEPDYTVSYRYYEQTGYFQKKYINVGAWDDESNSFKNSWALVEYPGVTTMTSASLVQVTDLIHIRFADVLLMHSELTETADGMNRVRARSHLAPIAYSLENLKNERRWELAFESIRWFDILRWAGPSLESAGELLNKQTGFDLINEGVVTPMVKYDYAARLKQTQGYWPIPQDEIDLSGGVLEQNPGWDASAAFVDWNNFK